MYIDMNLYLGEEKVVGVHLKKILCTKTRVRENLMAKHGAFTLIGKGNVSKINPCQKLRPQQNLAQQHSVSTDDGPQLPQKPTSPGSVNNQVYLEQIKFWTFETMSPPPPIFFKKYK